MLSDAQSARRYVAFFRFDLVSISILGFLKSSLFFVGEKSLICQLPCLILKLLASVFNKK